MNIYELLREIIVIKKNSITSSIYSDEEKNKLDNTKDREIFKLLKNISSIEVKITNKGISFYPMIVCEGKRSFAIEDLSEEDFNILLSLELSEMPLNLSARIADILWTQKKDYKFALTAADSYLDLFKIWYSVEEWIGTLDMIKRAIYISSQIKYERIYKESCSIVYNEILKLYDKDESFLSLRLLNIILIQPFGDKNILLEVIENLIKKHSNNVKKVEQAYNAKILCLNNLNKKDKIKESNLELAEYYVNCADNIMGEDIQGLINAEQLFQKAIVLYRNNGEAAKGDQVRRHLLSVQSDITKFMIPITTDIDVRGLIANIDINMQGLTFEECVIRLIQMVTFPKKEDVNKKLFRDCKDNPLTHLFAKKILNSAGQTVLILPPLNYRNPEENEGLLDLYLHQKSLEEQIIIGNIWLKYSFQYLSSKFNIKLSDLDFLINNNPIIPLGREQIFKSAIYMVLKGQFYEAMHILAPQVENLFRTIGKEVGGLTVTLENDGTSKEKVLSSIFDLPELLDCYDNDIIFMFKGLLNEQAGANIRNEIAHGIVCEASANSGAYIFFVGAVIKLLSYTSIRCLKIINNFSKLNTFIKPDIDAFKIKS